jgi:hypothetical protein
MSYLVQRSLDTCTSPCTSFDTTIYERYTKAGRPTAENGSNTFQRIAIQQRIMCHNIIAYLSALTLPLLALSFNFAAEPRLVANAVLTKIEPLLTHP